MKKFMKYSLVSAIILIFTITVYPVLLDRYGENLVIIRQLFQMLVVMALFNYADRSISKYGLGIYRYYKLLGMKEINIVAGYMTNSFFRYFLCFCLFFTGSYDGELLSALLCTVQFIMYCNCLVLALYVLMHKDKYKRILFWVFLVTGVLCITGSLFQVSGLISHNAAVMEIVVLLNNGSLMTMYRAVFLECRIGNIAIAAVLMALLIKKTGSLDDVSVIEDIPKKERNSPETFFQKFIGQKRYGLIRDVKITFRKKENLFSYGLAFGLYVFCCCLFGHIPKLLSGVSLFCIVLINYGLESVYRNDTGSYTLYKLLGQDFNGFIQRKLRVSLTINVIFASVYTIKCMNINCVKEWCLLLVIHIISIWYWNMYYCCLYSGRKMSGTILYEIKRFIVLIIGLIPVLHILFAVMYYKKGKRRWNTYVNNGQGDKEI